MSSIPGKPNKATGSEQVVGYLGRLDSPIKDVLEEVRALILNTNDQVTEHVKWNAPSFCIRGEDRITFNLNGKGIFRLVFHCGAKAKEQPAQDRLFADSTGLLEWASNDRATLILRDRSDLEQKREKLKDVVVKWLEITSVQ